MEKTLKVSGRDWPFTSSVHMWVCVDSLKSIQHFSGRETGVVKSRLWNQVCVQARLCGQDV